MYRFRPKQQTSSGTATSGEKDKENISAEEAGRHRTVLYYLILGLVSAILLFGSYSLKPHVGEYPGANVYQEYGSSFLKDLGIAGLVAIFLAITFERLSSDEFRKLAIRERNLAKADVFYYVYGYGIPESIRNEINTKILKSVFVRNNMSLRYTLRKIVEDRREYMLVRLVVRYEVQNLTSADQTLPIVGGLEKPFRASLGKYVKIEKLKVEADGRTLVEKDEAHLKDEKIVTTDDAIEVALYLDGPVVVGPQRSAVVTLVYQTVNHYEGGYDYFTLSHHTCKLDVAVLVPNNDVAVSLRDFGGEELQSETAEHNPDEGSYHWFSPTPMLLNQGVYLAWHPRTPASTSNNPMSPHTRKQGSRT